VSRASIKVKIRGVGSSRVGRLGRLPDGLVVQVGHLQDRRHWPRPDGGACTASPLACCRLIRRRHERGERVERGRKGCMRRRAVDRRSQRRRHWSEMFAGSIRGERRCRRWQRQACRQHYGLFTGRSRHGEAPAHSLVQHGHSRVELVKLHRWFFLDAAVPFPAAAVDAARERNHRHSTPSTAGLMWLLVARVFVCKQNKY